MSETDISMLIGRGGDASLASAAQLAERSPEALERMLGLLYCGRREDERNAARVLDRLSASAPALLEPFVRRLFRVAAASEDRGVRTALADALPRIRLGRGEAGRMAFVLESWLDDPDTDVQRAAMAALVALIPQRPELATRIRRSIETRAARGSPAARGYGLALLDDIKEF